MLTYNTVQETTIVLIHVNFSCLISKCLHELFYQKNGQNFHTRSNVSARLIIQNFIQI